MDKNIITECFVDTCLVESLVVTTVGYNHQKGCNNVVKVMQGKLADKFALGIVDKDKRSLEYLEEFEEKERFNEELYLYKHKTKPHYIIQIAPAVEEFILKNAQTCNITLATYGLPTVLNQFIDETKTIKVKGDARFLQLFAEFKRRNVESITKLTGWIEYLKTNPYNP